MKRFLSIILFFAVSTVFVLSLFGLSKMHHFEKEGGCFMAEVSGFGDCLGVENNVNMILGHIRALNNLTLAVFDLFSFVSVLLVLICFFLFKFWDNSIRSLLIWYEQDNYSKLKHRENKAFFPIRPIFLLNWFKIKIRGGLPLCLFRVYFEENKFLLA